MISLLFILYELIPKVICQTPSGTAQSPITYSIPFEAQLPWIARVGQSYNWTFDPNTFTGSNNLTYSAPIMPAWLSLSGHTFSGTPKAADAGQSTVSVIATDILGNNVTGSLPILVSGTIGPTLEIPFASQLSNSTTATVANSTVGALQVKAGDTATFTFANNTFAYAGQLYYSVATSNHGPLPAWVTFDSTSRSFTINPAATALPDSVNITVAAGDAQNFTGANDHFNISIYQHQISVLTPIPDQHVYQGNETRFVIPYSTFAVDETTVSQANQASLLPTIQLSTTPDGRGPIPNWIVFYPANWTLRYIPYTPATSQNIYVTVIDTVGDRFTTKFNLTVDPHPPPHQLGIVPDIYISTPEIHAALPVSLIDTINASPLWYTAEFLPSNGSADWLHFNDINNTITGRANFIGAQNITVTLTGYNIWNGTANTSFHIFFQPTLLLMMSADVGNTPSRILAIVLPTVFGFLLLVLVLLCLYAAVKRIRRDKRQQFRGESVIPPMSKPIAYNDPFPAGLHESELMDDGHHTSSDVSNRSDPPLYASRRLSNPDVVNKWANKRSSSVSGNSDSTIQAVDSRPWSEGSTTVSSGRPKKEDANQIFIEEVQNSAVAKEAAWRQHVATDMSEKARSKSRPPFNSSNRSKSQPSGDSPRGPAHGGHILKSGNISDLQIGQSVKQGSSMMMSL
ncbi:hypothetical protein INT43_002519 [Umbelopsis isabellina]|uniref:Dystroglycan-type cadherin-like domain-containing protein n=1 Tax=Mortierella isabellina TaxID=91625 RepID=A0A8H7UHJ5_MORIS|nr:hypothetical protein INT43_002519 [Umbelopsis isabellina]